MAKHTVKPVRQAQGRMDGNSSSPQKELAQLLKTQFPQIFAEGKVNPDKLKQSLGEELDTNNERYGLSWAGKAECFRHIQEMTTATLKPLRSESVDFDKTENIFIEGDNLEVLKVLQRSYYGKIKMIYIDPPYNTGNDSFIYPDRFKEEKDDYELRAGIKDAEGLLTKDGFWRKNSKDAGHFHSNWLSMMYPRLFLAKNLLRDDGVIFVSIDDNEIQNLRMIMDEVFGEENFVGNFIWYKKLTWGYDNNWVNSQHEYVLTYSKNKNLFNIGRIKKESNYSLKDEKGRKYKWDSLWSASLTYSKSLDYQIKAPDGTLINPIGPKGKAFWLWSKEKVQRESHLLKFQKDKDGKWKVYKRVYAS